MNAVGKYLKLLRTMRHKDATNEITKLGIYVKQRASREELFRAIDALDPAVVQEHLDKLNQIPTLDAGNKRATGNKGTAPANAIPIIPAEL
jgi:hypothetical protein